MGVSYDAATQLWSFTPDPLLPLNPVNYPPTYYMNVTWRNDANFVAQDIVAEVSTTPGPNTTPTTTPIGGSFPLGGLSTGFNNPQIVGSVARSFEIPIEWDRQSFAAYGDSLNGHLQNNLGQELAYSVAVQGAARGFGQNQQPALEAQVVQSRANEQANNDVIIPYNTEVETANSQLPEIEAIIASTQGDDYVTQRDLLRNYGVAGLEDNFKSFYLTEKLQPWDQNLGAKPLYGAFDPAYYTANNPALLDQWNAAVANDDLDITARYGENGYYLWHYTNVGKPAGARGNAPEATAASTAYLETKPTDLDLQNVRNLQLGVDTGTQTQRVLNIPEVAAQWDLAKRSDPYWQQLGKEYFLDVNKPDDFVALFRLSDRPEDKQVSLDYNINAGYGITQLEDALNQAVGEKATVDVKKFGALAQDVLRETINEMKQVKAQEEMLDLFRGFSGFNEIMDINKTLTNSILGDTGVGGIVSFTSGGKAEQSLEESLKGITGVGNNAVYNWQQWFDTQLKTRYEQDLQLGYTTAEAQEMVNIEGAFAREFITNYLDPRFNTARSMDEFVEYLDIRQEEQNPFQTQDMLNAVTLVADLRAQQYLDSVSATPDRAFDSVFYFNPTGDKAREAQYAEQAQTVSADWEAAKAGDPYWAQQAYRFGVDVNDQDAFARMHFEVKGQGQGYDAAEDILNAGKVQDEIFNNILPALQAEALAQGSVFGQFVTPEEFADELLKGLDPNDQAARDEVLQRYGLTDFKGTLDELKNYIAETLRGDSAQKIREEIKYLNEKRQRPTQEILGLTYIERPEDFKDQQATPETELYKVFQSAGYQGTEDDFYNNFFPDLERSEQTLLTKAGQDTSLQSFGLDLSDPFASLGTIESFFDEDTTTTKQDSNTTGTNFFSLDSDNTDASYKSASGEKILGEFTSMFKGL